MKRAILRFLGIFLILTLIWQLQRMAFMALYHPEGANAADWLQTGIHGLTMDMSIAGYLTLIPGLLILAQCLTSRQWPDTVLKIYFGIISLSIAIVTVVDLTLYSYWGFRLDATPVFYFTTSPASALASATIWQLIGGFFAILAIAVGIYLCLERWNTVGRKISDTGAQANIGIKPSLKMRLISAGAMLLLTAALIIPIRGGFSLAPMNVGRAYFSDVQRLNHAAVNPAFSLLYSLTHQNHDADRFTFMSSDEADQVIKQLEAIFANEIDTIPTLSVEKPDIYLVILESFSSKLLPSQGGEPIAVGLDSLMQNSVAFTNFYASSFRTDRAITSILSGFPALPTKSILKNVEQIDRLPHLSQTLKANGYSTEYYYGGDINFANFNAYLISGGYDKIVSDKDFAPEESPYKWGAPDEAVFERAKKSVNVKVALNPKFVVVQTSSSHEPFEVPYANPRFASEPAKNAFAYTDSCLVDFIRYLESQPSWARTLVAIVPDHLGAWPLDLPDATQRHHVPFLLTGGSLRGNKAKITTPASQTDIATLLRTLAVGVHKQGSGVKASNGIATFSEPEIFGIITPCDTAIYNIESSEFVIKGGSDAELLRRATLAYLQRAYAAEKAL